MPYFILALAAATILLIGCGGTIEERQERARNVLDATKATVLETVDGAKQATENATTGITEVTTKLQATATDIQKRAEDFQEGVQKVTNAVQAGREGIDQVRGVFETSASSSIGE